MYKILNYFIYKIKLFKLFLLFYITFKSIRAKKTVFYTHFYTVMLLLDKVVDG